jgi:predicted TPR repeat methyltransferase
MIDLGCGTWATSGYLPQRVLKKVYGIDVSEMMIKQLKKEKYIEGIRT